MVPYVESFIILRRNYTAVASLLGVEGTDKKEWPTVPPSVPDDKPPFKEPPVKEPPDEVPPVVDPSIKEPPVALQ